MFATVNFAGAPRSALLVPSEAVIRTGKRALVMLALDQGRYQPAEVKTGLEADGQTEVLAGLSEGEKVITSGQFLIDSEASLSGMDVRPIGGAPPPQAARPKTYTASGRTEKHRRARDQVNQQ